MEVKVRAPCFIDDERDIVLVGRFGDSDQVGGDAVVRRRDNVHALDAGVLAQRGANDLRRDGVIHVQRLIDFGLHPNRRRAAHDEATHRRFVRIARQKNPIARVERGHHHALIAAGRTVDEKERVLRAEAFRRELLRFDQRSFGLQQIVQTANLGQIDRQHIIADKVAECPVHPDALLVARGMKWDHARIDIIQEYLKVRRARLIELIARDNDGVSNDHNGRDYSTDRSKGDGPKNRKLAAMLYARSSIVSRSIALRILLVVCGSLLMALSAKIVVPMIPVPITGQTLAVALLVSLLGRNLATMALLTYLVEGALGLPVFATGALMSATGGYLFAFPLAAFAIGWLFERGWDRSYVRRLAAIFAGTSLVFVGGVAWLIAVYHTGAQSAIAVGVLPFVIGDVIKCSLAAGLGPVWPKIAARLGI